jgi:hypothetical protein
VEALEQRWLYGQTGGWLLSDEAPTILLKQSIEVPIEIFVAYYLQKPPSSLLRDGVAESTGAVVHMVHDFVLMRVLLIFFTWQNGMGMGRSPGPRSVCLNHSSLWRPFVTFGRSFHIAIPKP